jgi:hypothetical protein
MNGIPLSRSKFISEESTFGPDVAFDSPRINMQGNFPDDVKFDGDPVYKPLNLDVGVFDWDIVFPR